MPSKAGTIDSSVLGYMSSAYSAGIESVIKYSCDN